MPQNRSFALLRQKKWAIY
eukprot:CCRYP_004135-RA/>CCRYP_004135-RA protein AED:0.48 eAED:1.00 QI:0/-1/0/1/-1/0/1/0/18